MDTCNCNRRKSKIVVQGMLLVTGPSCICVYNVFVLKIYVYMHFSGGY